MIEVMRLFSFVKSEVAESISHAIGYSAGRFPNTGAVVVGDMNEYLRYPLGTLSGAFLDLKYLTAPMIRIIIPATMSIMPARTPMPYVTKL